MERNGEALSYTYVIPEPYERGLRMLKEALAREGLEVAMELDISGRIRKKLGIGLAPCRLLCVDCPMTLMEALAIDTMAGVHLPVSVVVSGGGRQTKLHLSSYGAVVHSEAPPGVKAAVGRVHARLARAVQQIGMRQMTCAG